jgi:hypothetical protein
MMTRMDNPLVANPGRRRVRVATKEEQKRESKNQNEKKNGPEEFARAQPMDNVLLEADVFPFHRFGRGPKDSGVFPRTLS